MKTLQITAPGAFEIVQRPIPRPGSGEVLMRVDAVTTCPQWDLHLWHDEPMFVGHKFHYPYAPGQPGHEGTGTIAAIGSGVTDIAVGDRVSAWRDPGHAAPGCYAHYVLLKEDSVIRVPAGLPAEATASVELAMCVGATFLLLRRMDAIAGRRFGVMGLGPAGLIAAQMARAEGAAEVIGFDLSAARRALAHSVGVDDAFSTQDELSARFPARPDRPALDCGVDCVGARTTVEYLMDRTADVVALFGVQREDYRFGVRHCFPHGLRLCGYPGHSREAAEYAVGLIRSGALDLTPLVTHLLPLERYDEALALLERQEAVKVCFHPWEEATAHA